MIMKKISMIVIQSTFFRYYIIIKKLEMLQFN
jgi:hypothetical protein